jgi:Tfp pilus assembly protein PilN
MKIRLNLATVPLENNRRFLTGAGAIGVVGLAAFVLLSLHTFRTWRSNRELRIEIASLGKRIESLEQQQASLRAYFQNAQTKEATDRAAFLNALIEQRSFPWTKVFMDLEQILPGGVRVVSLSPKMKNGRVEITLLVGAASDEAKLKFLKALETSKVFSGIQVTQEQHPARQSSTDQVVLELVAWYSTT